MTSFLVSRNALASSFKNGRIFTISVCLNIASCNLPNFLECYDNVTIMLYFSKCLQNLIINSRFNVCSFRNDYYIRGHETKPAHVYKKRTNGVSTFDGVSKCDQIRLHRRRRVTQEKEAEENRALQ